jgi:hypothetical protein
MPEDANTQLTPAEIEQLVRDFRSARMDSLEGAGRARQRLDDFYELGPGPELAMELNRAEVRSSFPDPDDEPVLDAEEARALAAYREEAAKAALEEADLIGFWVAWHRAGGFRGLENAGWHRTTIHRRVKRFRLRFGVHPDDMTFSWISLDVERCWVEEYEQLIHQANTLPGPPDEDY